MISANGGLPAHRYTPQVTPRWPQGFEPDSVAAWRRVGNFGGAADASFAGLRCHPALPVAGPGVAEALSVAGAPAAGTGLGVCMDVVARGLGGGVLSEAVVAEVEDVDARIAGSHRAKDLDVVAEVVELEAEETDMGDGGGSQVDPEVKWTDVGDGQGSRTAGAGAVCVRVLVPWVVSCVVCGGVGELSCMRGFVSYPGEVHYSSRTCRFDCWRQSRVPKKHRWMPGMYSPVRWS